MFLYPAKSYHLSIHRKQLKNQNNPMPQSIHYQKN
uniref:Uncharacterized protein n=1 Tax=Anguilla anguilla TaxID=7936 RepID=A0A0E9R9J8_ANGAN